MEDQDLHTKILVNLGKVSTKVDGINNRLDTLNGKVIKNQDKINKHDIWRGYYTGALAILSILVLPLAIWLLVQLYGLNDTIRQEVSTSIERELNLQEFLEGRIIEEIGNLK